MIIEKEIPVYDFVHVISKAVDLVSPVLYSHHEKVAYVSCRIAQEMQLPAHEIQDIALASMLHDIGAFSIGERIKAHVFDYPEGELHEHALLGYKLLKGFAPLKNAAMLIKDHHKDYSGSKNDFPIGSHIIHLADRVCCILDENREILAQVPLILEKINLRSRKYHPAALAALERLAKLEYFWIEASSPEFGSFLLQKLLFSIKISGLDTFLKFAKLIAQIIDFRSRFTATHSSGVAIVARELTVISGFSERECIMMEIAGLLHDLGKLSVPDDILEKNGGLDSHEINIVRKHTYYTYNVLSKISGLEDIAILASYHHERQDGKGYPFHVKGRDFPKLARIMAVADVFSAITEDRPYRAGMDREKAVEIMSGMAETGGIDKHITELANKNFIRINFVRANAQREAKNEYINFHETPDQLMADTLQSA